MIRFAYYTANEPKQVLKDNTRDEAKQKMLKLPQEYGRDHRKKLEKEVFL